VVVAAVVVAAGRGRRLGRPEPKAFVPVGGRPMLAYSLATLRAVDGVGELVVVLPPGEERDLARRYQDLLSAYAVSATVGGGEERWQSVAAGLAALGKASDLVLIQDAARPLVTAELAKAVIEKAAEVGAAIAAEPLADTLKEVTEDMLIGRTLDRGRYWRAQTPQVFRRGLITEAYVHAGRLRPTDDAQLVEALGAPVAIVVSSTPNLKVTTASDLLVAEQLLAERSAQVRRAGGTSERIEQMR
jgi:2-C-methyl-D-erythritol 4-phosphate cytidylyltransferase